jgi:hypothetical protein
LHPTESLHYWNKSLGGWLKECSAFVEIFLKLMKMMERRNLGVVTPCLLAFQVRRIPSIVNRTLAVNFDAWIRTTNFGDFCLQFCPASCDCSCGTRCTVPQIPQVEAFMGSMGTATAVVTVTANVTSMNVDATMAVVQETGNS